MSSRNSFYLVLPSNSSRNFYPDNTMSHYTTRLSKTIELEGGPWECALVEILFTKTWFTIPRAGLDFFFTCETCDEVITDPDEPDRYSNQFVLTLPTGYYSTPESFVAEISRIISEGMSRRLFRVLGESGYVLQSLPPEQYPRLSWSSMKNNSFFNYTDRRRSNSLLSWQ